MKGYTGVFALGPTPKALKNILKLGIVHFNQMLNCYISYSINPGFYFESNKLFTFWKLTSLLLALCIKILFVVI